jgi:hypothetical protein
VSLAGNKFFSCALMFKPQTVMAINVKINRSIALFMYQCFIYISYGIPVIFALNVCNKSSDGILTPGRTSPAGSFTLPKTAICCDMAQIQLPNNRQARRLAFFKQFLHNNFFMFLKLLKISFLFISY